MTKRRRQYGTGSVYQTSDGRWRGSFDAGYTDQGKRRRIVVTAATEAQAKTKLSRRIREHEAAGTAARRAHTVKTWADEWLVQMESLLGPSTWITHRGQLRRWVIPAIGHKRLADLTHADIRAVATRQHEAGQAAASVSRARSMLLRMLRDAVADGHTVPAAVVSVAPRTRRRQATTENREGLTNEQALAVLEVARQHLPHHSRWAIAMLQGLRRSEALGLTWDAVDLENGQLSVEWQLKPLPYRVPRDPSSGFRIPIGYEARPLWKAYHLVRPKTTAGKRVIPLVDYAVDQLADWRRVAPESPYGLVWPRPDGKPPTREGDHDEWEALQGAAGVGHPDVRYFHIHEIRHTTATLLLAAGIEIHVVEAILGHTDAATSLIYARRSAERTRPAMEALASVLRLEA